MATRTRRLAPPPPVDRAAALAAEEAFFERLGNNLNAAMGVTNPLDNRTYDASARNRVVKVLDDRSVEVKALVKKHAERDLLKTYEEMPKNPIHVAEIVHKELLGPRTARVAVAGASFSPAEDLIRRGSSAKRATAEELARVKDALTGNPNVFTFLGAFSPTGWEEAAKSLLVGPNFLVALCDLPHGAWRTWYAPDGRWRSAARIFDLSSEAEKVEAVRRFVKRRTYELLMDEMTEDLVFDELGYSVPLIRSAFDRMAEEDPFLRFDMSAKPFRLVRIYG